MVTVSGKVLERGRGWLEEMMLEPEGEEAESRGASRDELLETITQSPGG